MLNDFISADRLPSFSKKEKACFTFGSISPSSEKEVLFFSESIILFIYLPSLFAAVNTSSCCLILSKAKSFIIARYGEEAATEMENSLADNHGIEIVAPKQSPSSVDEVPVAVGAGAAGE